MPIRGLVVACVLLGVATAEAATFTVTTAAGSGAGSLADAVDQANAVAGPHTIEFAIPGAGVHVIPTANAYQLLRAITIDGTTQPGYAPGAPVIFLDGTAHIGGGISISTFAGGGSVVRGLGFTHYAGLGIYVNLAQNVVVESNTIGLDPAGTTDTGGTSPGIWVMDAISTRIGGPSAAQRNVIAGVSSGVMVTGACNGLVVQGNYLGTNRGGTAAVANTYGIRVLDSAGVQVSDNLISGNTIGLDLSSGANGWFYGNRIGLDATGTAAIPNGTGVLVETPNIYLGGPAGTAAERNVISGNTGTGVWAEGNAAGLRLYGAYIGLDPTGTTAIGNGLGVFLNTGADDAILGMAGEGRLVIAGNADGGISIARVTGTFIYNTDVGVAADGTTARGNGSSGVSFYDATDGTLGTSGPDGACIVANSAGDGVLMMTDAAAVIEATRIYGNGGAGLAGDSLLAATATVTRAERSGTTTVVQGTITGAASTSHRIVLYTSTACDASGSGEGETVWSGAEVVTAADGTAAFSALLGSAVPAGHVVTATVSDLVAGNTSGFSACRAVCPELTLAPAMLPPAQPGVAYAQTLTPGGGAGPYTIALVDGTPPAGIALAGDALTGTPGAVGGATLTFRVTDANGCSHDHVRPFAAGCAPIAIAPGTLPDAIVDEPYAATLTATGGVAPYTYSPTGALGWVEVMVATGELSGTPASAGTASFSIVASDAFGCTGTQAYTIVAAGPGDAPDAGVAPDAGETAEDGDAGGCCSTGGGAPGSAALAIVLGLAGLRRRARRDRPR